MWTPQCSQSETLQSHRRCTTPLHHRLTFQTELLYYSLTLSFQIIGPPGPPQSLRVTRTLTNSLTLVWSRPAPSTPPSAATTAYSIICSASGRTTRRARTTTLSATVSSLTPSTSYNCCVAADSSRGLSTYLCVIATTLTDSKYIIQ